MVSNSESEILPFDAGRRDPGNPGLDDEPLPLHGRVANVEEQAPTLERLGELSGVVGGQKDHGDLTRRDGPELRDRDLVLAEHLEHQRFGLKLHPVDLIDQEHHLFLAPHCLKQWPRDEKFLGKNIFNMAAGAACIHGFDF